MLLPRGFHGGQHRNACPPGAAPARGCGATEQADAADGGSSSVVGGSSLCGYSAESSRVQKR